MIRNAAARRLAATVVVPAAALALVACGDDDSGSGDTEAPSEQTVAPPDDTDASTMTGATTATSAVDTTTATSAVDTTTATSDTEASVDTTTATSDTEVSVATSEAGDGFVFTSPGGDLTLTFPGEPTEQVQDITLPEGSTIQVPFWSYQESERAFTAARAEYPAELQLDPATSLQGAQDQAIANVGGTLIDSREIELQGRPGREFSAGVTSNGVEGTLLAHIYLDGNVQYQVLAVGAGELTFDDEDLAAYFGSVQLAA